MKKNWYAVYTKPHFELKVAALLTRKKIDNYCPLNRIIYTSGNRKKTGYDPLFNSFVFVYIHESEMSYVRQTNGVINFIYWLGKPAVIGDTEIRCIQQFSGTYSNLKLEKTNVNLKGMVRTTNETKTSEDGNLLVHETVTIKMHIPSIGYVLVAEGENQEADVFDYSYAGSKMVS